MDTVRSHDKLIQALRTKEEPEITSELGIELHVRASTDLVLIDNPDGSFRSLIFNLVGVNFTLLASGALMMVSEEETVEVSDEKFHQAVDKYLGFRLLLLENFSL